MQVVVTVDRRDIFVGAELRGSVITEADFNHGFIEYGTTLTEVFDSLALTLV